MKQHLRACLYILTSLLSESTHISITEESLSTFLYNDPDCSGILLCEPGNSMKPSSRIGHIRKERPQLPLYLFGFLPL